MHWAPSQTQLVLIDTLVDRVEVYSPQNTRIPIRVRTARTNTRIFKIGSRMVQLCGYVWVWVCVRVCVHACVYVCVWVCV
jgi:hypothetical protein